MSSLLRLARDLLFGPHMNGTAQLAVTVELIDNLSGERTAQRAFPTGSPSPEIKRFSAPFPVVRADGGRETHWVHASISDGRKLRVVGGSKNDDPEQARALTATLRDGQGSLSYDVAGRYDVRVTVGPKVPTVPPPARTLPPPGETRRIGRIRG